MSRDGMKDAFPITPDFADGEGPTSGKLDAWAAQTNNMASKLEAAAGDLHDDISHTGTQGGSHSYILGAYDLNIVNIARLMGAACNLNPDQLGPIRVEDYQYTITTLSSIQREMTLPFPPKTWGGSSWSESTITFSAGAAAIFASKVGSKTAVNSTGEYYVDWRTGVIYTFDRITCTNETATYTFDSEWSSYEDAGFNVFPHPQQESGGILCTVVDNGTDYTVTLPDATVDKDGTSISGDKTSASFHPNAYAGGAEASHAMCLPKILRTNLNQADTIPEGFIYLFHKTDGLITGATYKYEDYKSVKVSGVTLTAGNAAYYLITVGADISRHLDELSTRSGAHAHTGGDSSTRISHNDLKDLFDAYDVNFQIGHSPVQGNCHPQYLHRRGYHSNDPVNHYNGMIGSLVMCSQTSDGNFHNLDADSRSLYFGQYANGPRMYYNSGYDCLYGLNKPFRWEDTGRFTSLATAQGNQMRWAIYEFDWVQAAAYGYTSSDLPAGIVFAADLADKVYGVSVVGKDGTTIYTSGDAASSRHVVLESIAISGSNIVFTIVTDGTFGSGDKLRVTLFYTP